MNKKEALTLIHTLKQNYKPYHPISNPNLPIYVHYIKDAMDKEESLRDGKVYSTLNFILRHNYTI